MSRVIIHMRVDRRQSGHAVLGIRHVVEPNDLHILRHAHAAPLQLILSKLDPASLRATRSGSELQLSPIGLRLLTILMRESPRVVSRQEIEREIWGDDLPDSDTLRSHLYNLRKVIDKPFDRPLLHTVQSAGYRIADLAD